MTRKTPLAVALALGLLLGGASGLHAFAAPATDLQSISFEKEGSAVAVIIKVSGEFGNEAFTLREPERLVIDLSPVDSIQAPPQIDVGAGGVLRVRTGRFQAAVARLVFDLEAPGVMYRIDRTAEGLKVTFWREGQAAVPEDEKAPAVHPPAVQPAQAVQEKPVEAPPVPPAPPAAEAPREAPPSRAPAIAGTGERGFFALLGGGFGAFVTPESVFTRTFDVDGRAARADSTFKPKMNLAAAIGGGRYVRLQEMVVKLGLEAAYWSFKSDGAHVFTIPHPVMADADRTLEATSSLGSYFTVISVHALARVWANDTLTVSVGPEIGVAFGKHKFLDTIVVEDHAPFTEADISLGEVTYAGISASSLLAGGRVNLEYALSPRLSLLFDLKAVYVSPEIGELSKKLGLSQAGAFIGVQYNF
jgi:hypothetical protein